ncbi:MAG: HU family DNA-binding protein [Candidatus Marinimicrobia bacterium]|nr:HU family DNA-binding protein [Candidatus Neomarinimicrobiota bacterium]
MAEKKAPVKPMTKSEIVSGIADSTGLTKNDVNSVFEAMAGQIKKSLSRNGPGAYTVPGLMKLVVQRKPATKARKGIEVLSNVVDEIFFGSVLLGCRRIGRVLV